MIYSSDVNWLNEYLAELSMSSQWLSVLKARWIPEIWDHGNVWRPWCHWGCTDLHCHLGQCWHSDLAAADDHIWVFGPTAARVCVATKGYTEAQGQGHNLWPCWCLGPCCQQSLIWVAFASTKREPRYHQGPRSYPGPCLCPWSCCSWDFCWCPWPVSPEGA